VVRGSSVCTARTSGARRLPYGCSIPRGRSGRPIAPFCSMHWRSCLPSRSNNIGDAGICLVVSRLEHRARHCPPGPTPGAWSSSSGRSRRWWFSSSVASPGSDPLARPRPTALFRLKPPKSRCLTRLEWLFITRAGGGIGERAGGSGGGPAALSNHSASVFNVFSCRGSAAKSIRCTA